MGIVIISSIGSNINSVQNAISRITDDFIISEDPALISQANHVILPGVSNIKDCMDNILRANLGDLIKSLKQPVLGICSGMQMMLQRSNEFSENTKCLGIFEGEVTNLKPEAGIQVPHMGWNWVGSQKNADDFGNMYFSHSNYVDAKNPATIYETNYGSHKIATIIQKDNFVGIQAHPEKSGQVGDKFLRWFLSHKKAV